MKIGISKEEFLKLFERRKSDDGLYYFVELTKDKQRIIHILNLEQLESLYEKYKDSEKQSNCLVIYGSAIYFDY